MYAKRFYLIVCLRHFGANITALQSARVFSTKGHHSVSHSVLTDIMRKNISKCDQDMSKKKRHAHKFVIGTHDFFNLIFAEGKRIFYRWAYDVTFLGTCWSDFARDLSFCPLGHEVNCPKISSRSKHSFLVREKPKVKLARK